MDEHNSTAIATGLPKAWEQEETFHDALYDWMQRAPWLGISLGLHFVAYFMLLAIPWHLFQEAEPQILNVSQPEVTPIEEEEPPVPIEKVTEEDVIDPVIQDAVSEDIMDVNDIADFTDPVGDPEDFSKSPFDNPVPGNVIGLGSGGGGFKGNRGTGRGGKGGGGRAVNITIAEGLNWLKQHQSEDGSWDVDEYYANNVTGGSHCTEGGGIASQDVGITALALLAFLGDGTSTRGGHPEYLDTVRRGIKWLNAQQDPDTGLIGQQIGHAFVYDHAIATLAMAENYYESKNPIHRQKTQLALNYIARARAPYGGWRYDVPSDGDTDTSITGWMIFALKAGEDAKLKVDKESYLSALEWLDSVTDTTNGRVGYIGPERGGKSSRTEANSEFDPDLGEAMTGVGLLTRIFLGQTPNDTPIMRKHGDLMLRSMPEWDAKGHKVDMYYWYYGTYAMFQLGGEHWNKWKGAMENAIIPNQRKDGDYKGSWDPIGPWGYQGGRCYSTATMVLTLEVYYRYSSLLGAR